MLRILKATHSSCSPVLRFVHIQLTPVFPLSAQLRSTTRQLAQCYLILEHFQHSKFTTVYICIAKLGTLHCLCVCVVGQLHALRVQQNRRLLSVEFS